MSVFLIIPAWQVAMTTAPAKALGWVSFQTMAIIGTPAQGLDLDLCFIIGLSFALQLCFVSTAQAMRRPAQALQREAETGRALAETNRELRSAQASIANTARDAERLRISRELHDA